MDDDDILQAFLQTYLADEAHSVTFLPAILSGLSSCDVENSAHLSKWINKVNSLIHSKDAAVRWAGLCLALKTSQLAKSAMLSSGQGWVTVVLPLLSKTDNSVTYKAAIRLLSFIFTATSDLPEFQRQVVTPNVPKFSSALISLADKFADLNLKVYCMDVLSFLVQRFPSLHRPLAAQLSSMSLSFLNGSPTSPTPEGIMNSACRLHACLHVTGGKVGGSALWRKSMDETIAFCSESLTALRSGPSNPVGQYRDDPMAFTNVNVDRLHCGTELLRCLLCTPVSRPVLVPVKSLVSLCSELLSLSSKEASNDMDPSFDALAASSRIHVLRMACKLTSVVAACVGRRLGPEHSRLLSTVAFNLEQPLPICQRLPLVSLLPPLLGSCFHAADPLITGRVVKTLLPTLAQIFSQKSSVEGASAQVKGNKKAKKRVQGYEGDEVFKAGKEVIFSFPEEGEFIVRALDALSFLLRTPELPEYLQSLTSRILLSMLMILPTMSAASVSYDLALHGKILSRVKDITLELASASGSVLSQSLPLVVAAVGSDIESSHQSVRERLVVDLMLHPRLPPLLRPLPHLNEIALTSVEEGEEERKTREAIGVTDVHAVSKRDVLVGNAPISATPESDGRAGGQQRPDNDLASVAELNTSGQATSSAIRGLSMFSTPIDDPQQRSQVWTEGSSRINFEQMTHNSVKEVDMSTEDEPAPPASRMSPLDAIPHRETEKRVAGAKTGPAVKFVEKQQAQDSMMVDEEDDDGDIVIPPLSMASDSESDE